MLYEQVWPFFEFSVHEYTVLHPENLWKPPRECIIFPANIKYQFNLRYHSAAIFAVEYLLL